MKGGAVRAPERVLVPVARNDHMQCSTRIENFAGEELVCSSCERANPYQSTPVRMHDVMDTGSDVSRGLRRDVLVPSGADDGQSKPCSTIAR